MDEEAGRLHAAQKCVCLESSLEFRTVSPRVLGGETGTIDIATVDETGAETTKVTYSYKRQAATDPRVVTFVDARTALPGGLGWQLPPIWPSPVLDR